MPRLTLIFIGFCLLVACGGTPPPSPTPTYTDQQILTTATAIVARQTARSAPVTDSDNYDYQMERLKEEAAIDAFIFKEATRHAEVQLELHEERLEEQRIQATDDAFMSERYASVERELVRENNASEFACTWVNTNANLRAGPGTEYGGNSEYVRKIPTCR